MNSNRPHILSRLATTMGFFSEIARLLGFNQIRPTDLVFLVIGPSGVGKSSFINKVAGRNLLKVGHNLETTTTTFSHTLCPRGSNQRIVLVDTPPFPLSMQDEKKIKKWMNKCLGRNVTFHGILYLHRITDNRLNEPPHVHFNTFKQLAGGEFHSRVALVTTMWDTLRDTSLGQRREHEIVSSDWSEMMAKGSIVARHQNSEQSASVIMDQILQCSRSIV